MIKYISWNNKRRNIGYWISIELLLFVGLNISWWLDFSNSVLDIINTYFLLSINIRKAYMFLVSVIPVHLVVIVFIFFINHMAGYLPDMKNMKYLGIIQYPYKTVVWIDLVIGIALEELCIIGIIRLREVFELTSITMLFYMAIFVYGSVLYWKNVWPIGLYIKKIKKLRREKYFIDSMWYCTTNLGIRLSTFDRAPWKTEMAEFLVDSYDLSQIKLFWDTEVQYYQFVYQLIVIDLDEVVTTEFMKQVEMISNLPHTVVCVVIVAEHKENALLWTNNYSFFKSVQIKIIQGEKVSKRFNLHSLELKNNIQLNSKNEIAVKMIMNDIIGQTYLRLVDSPRISIDFIKLIINDLDILPAIYAMFDFIDMQYRISIACKKNPSIPWMKRNGRVIGNIRTMARIVKHEGVSQGTISTANIFNNVITSDEITLIRKYLPNYEIDYEEDVYDTVVNLTTSLRNVLRGHGTFDARDAEKLFELILKIALLNLHILESYKMSLRVGKLCGYSSSKDKIFSVVYENENGEEVTLNSFLIASENGNVYIFNNYYKNEESEMEYIDYLDGQLIRPEYFYVNIEQLK